MAEKYHDLTVYNFCFNNPVSFSDPSGADPIGSWEDFWNMILGIYYNGTDLGFSWYSDPNKSTRYFNSSLDEFYWSAQYMQGYLGMEIGGARVNSPVVNKSLKPTPAIFTSGSWFDKLFGL